MFTSEKLQCLTAAALGLLIFNVGSPAFAQSKSQIPGAFSWNVALASDYMFRGLTQTDGGPAIQAGMDYTYGVGDQIDLYLGLWGSNVDFNEGGGVNGATIETDLYGGLKGKLGRTGFSWEAGLIYYAYPDAASGLDYDFMEFKIAGAYDFGFAEFFLSVNYAPEYFGGSGEAVYTKAGANVPIPWVDGLSLSGHIAEQYIEDSAAFGSPDYFDWSFGVKYDAKGLFNASIVYTDTDITPETTGNDATIVLTIGKTF